jgi:hypothetical protein
MIENNGQFIASLRAEKAPAASDAQLMLALTLVSLSRRGHICQAAWSNQLRSCDRRRARLAGAARERSQTRDSQCQYCPQPRTHDIY